MPPSTNRRLLGALAAAALLLALPATALALTLHGLHGWEPEPETVRAPQGTAYVSWAELPRLSGPAGGTSLHVALAVLTGEPGGVRDAEAVTEVVPGAEGVDVVWADDGARTRVLFDPVRVTHTVE